MEGVNESHILTDPVSSAACPKCGAMLDVTGLSAFTSVQCPSCEFEFQVPARFGSFLLLQLLGAGGMGGVYRARDEGLNREVAIKVMLKSLGDDPQFVETFQREAQAAAKLNHPHIAQIYSFGQEKGQPYIAMELVSGGSLDRMMAEQGPLDPASVIHIGAQIAEGLREAAEAGMVHGDVKPENILFDNDKNAKLVDFGLSAMASGPGNDVWGTPYYIAPEKVRRQKSDFRSDIYSLGGTLYHAIAGVPPFEGEDATAVVKARFDGPPKPMGEIRGNVPAEVEVLVARMLEVEPQTRFPTYGSLLGDMRRYLAKAGPIKLDKGNKKIMIKGKHGGQTGKMSTTGALHTTGKVSDLPPGMTPVAEVEDVPESEEAAGKRGCKMMALIGGGAVFLIVLVVAGIFGGKKYVDAKKAKAEAAMATQKQAGARASIAKSVTNAKKLVERVNAYVPDVMQYAKEAADAVVAVLGEESRASMVPPEPDFSQLQPAAPAVAPTNAAQAAKDAKAAGGKLTLDPAMLATLAKELPPEQAKALGELEKLPPAEALAKLESLVKALPPEKAAALGAGLEAMKAMMSGMSGAMQQMAEGMAGAMTNAMQQLVGAAGLPAPAAEAEPAAKDQHPVVAIVRGMYEDAYAVKAASLLANSQLAQILALEKAGESLTRSDQTESLVKLNNTLVEKVNALQYAREIDDAARKAVQLKKTLASVRTDAASLAELKRQDSLEQEKKRKADEVADKKRQEQEAYQAKVKAEQDKVGGTELANVPTLKQLQFREAIRALKELADELETQEAKDTAAVALDRVNRIKDFHDHLVKKVPGYKSARGWAIDGADGKNLSVGGRKIQWTEVYEKHLEIVGELINGLVADPQATKDLRLREKTRLMTNAALCLNFFYKDIPSAQERAKSLATGAAQQFDVDADIIKQLLPEFFQ